MEQIGAGTAVGPIVDRYPRAARPRGLHLRRARLARLLGSACRTRDVERILRALGLDGHRRRPTAGTSTAPTFRVDLLREVDLIEEVGRHYGFDKLEPTFPALTAPAPPPDPRIAARSAGAARADGRRAVRSGDVRRSSRRQAAAPFAGATDRAVAASRTRCRRSSTCCGRRSLPGLVDAVAHNRRHGRRDVAAVRDRRAVHAPPARRARSALAWTGRRRRTLVGRRARGRLLRRQGRRRAAVRRARRRARASSRRALPFLVAGQAAPIVVADGRPARRRRCSVAPAIADARGAAATRTRCSSPSSISTRSRGAQPRPPSAHASAAAVSVRRARSVDRRADALPAEIIRGTIQAAARDAAPLVAIDVFRSLSGQRRAGRHGQSVAAADVPGARSHADRRRSADSVRHDSRGARARARRGATVRRSRDVPTVATMAATE